MPAELTKKVLREVKIARKYNHRRLVVLSGDDDEKLVGTLIAIVTSYVRKHGLREPILYAFNPFYGDGSQRKSLFKAGVNQQDLIIEFVPYHETQKVLGRTYDLAILDLINNLEPNDLGRLMGVVQGGGLYIFLTPKFSTYQKIITRFQSTLLTPQYGIESIRHLFVKRFLKKLFSHNGILIYDVDEDKIIKDFSFKNEQSIGKKEPILIPKKTLIPKTVYSLVKTRDQVEVLRLIEKLYFKPKGGEKQVIVITANRGRGKSSVIGMGVAGLAHKLRRAKGKCRILVTAPSPQNVEELFKFALKTLKRLNYDIKEEKLPTLITAKTIEIQYVTPIEALRKRAEILAVDEAASLHVPMLFKLLERFDRIIFSTTIHGYEGAGRGFTVRFLSRLKKRQDISLYEYEMKEPIRYSENDPIEKWLFDTLLLDAEPAQLNEEDLSCIERREVEYFKPKLEEFFLKREDLLRQFFGIYIMAHYRNNPNDLGMMMDAPHHFPRALMLKTGKLVVSLELAEEGPLKGDLAVKSARGAWIMGNIIPDRLIKHYKTIDFGELKGWRIVRIATHPEVMRKGLGSQALAYVEEEAREKGYDWVGAGFGVTNELLRFWARNGYTPVHLSPERNPVSGEYSLLVVKPLNSKAKRYVDFFAWEFKNKFISALTDPYFDLEAEVALILLEATPKKDIPLIFSKFQIGRLMTYIWSEMTYENCTDVMKLLARQYFLDKKGENAGLDKIHKLLLIAKVLQSKTWRMVSDELNIIPPEAMKKLREAAKILAEHYFGVKSRQEAEKYFFLRLLEET
ncbi:MAG: tRNA(Met) cytidine acetyltransferase [Thermoproteales archaeon]|nr:tRNA(Met) cytidine acetyltransferase [Thermoproteales archaeon]